MPVRLIFFALVAAVMGSCYPEVEGPSAAGGGGNGPSSGTGGGSEPMMTMTDGGQGATGMPCAVAAVFERNCLSCHASSPTLPRLDSASALMTAAAGGQSVGQRAIARMRSSAAPMPPAGVTPRPAPDEISTVESWVASNYPAGSCGTAAEPDAGVADAGPSPFSAQPTCTSGVFLNAGKRDKEWMNPGRACIACHAREAPFEPEVPDFVAAGTVYPTAHEPDGCAGVNGTATVVLTFADGATFMLQVNEAGNFGLPRRPGLKLPFTARVQFQGRERRMATPQTSGDCNSCHTQTGGSGAPGRILLP